MVRNNFIPGEIWQRKAGGKGNKDIRVIIINISLLLLLFGWDARREETTGKT
jgi:hypothetical protein